MKKYSSKRAKKGRTAYRSPSGFSQRKRLKAVKNRPKIKK